MSPNQQNIALADGLLEWMISQGLEDLVMCPGARNAPFVFRSQNRGLKLFEHYDERSAAFFALGLAKRKRKPVAVVTTSGTAAAELLAATAEAFYSGTPLWVITADRPKRMRFSGAPQTMPQNNFFKDFVDKSWDISEVADLPKENLSHQLSPMHFNICFDEPLITAVPEETKLKSVSLNLKNKFSRPQFVANEIGSKQIEEATKILSAAKNPLVWIGPVEPMWRPQLSTWLKYVNAPIVAEGASGMWPFLHDHHSWVKTGEPWVQWMKVKQPFDAVVRIGGIPTGRFWRDLETMKIPVVNISALEFAGLSRESVLTLPWEAGADLLSKLPNSLNEKLMKMDEQQQGELRHLLETIPSSECGMIHRWSRDLHAEDSLFIGNSLPIRQWDLVGWIAGHDLQNTWVNRGVNGIDGLISTFLGLCQEQHKNWCLIGDLSALYDFSGLWSSRFLSNVDMSVVIVNNFGGKIFERIFSNQAFLNTHDLNFEAMAKFWNFEYEKINGDWKRKSITENHKRLIELCPNNDETQKFWSQWEQSWKSIQ